MGGFFQQNLFIRRGEKMGAFPCQVGGRIRSEERGRFCQTSPALNAGWGDAAKSSYLTRSKA